MKNRITGIPPPHTHKDCLSCKCLRNDGMNYHKILTNLMAQPKGENRHSTYWVLIRHDISNEFYMAVRPLLFPCDSETILHRENLFRFDTCGREENTFPHICHVLVF